MIKGLWSRRAHTVYVSKSFQVTCLMGIYIVGCIWFETNFLLVKGL